MTGWQDLVGKNPPAGPAAEVRPVDGHAAVETPDEDTFAPQPDPSDYKAFLIQRGRSRPAMFLDLRAFDARSGTLAGKMLSYPHLIAIDYFDGHTIELNFGFRRFRIEGDGLAELVMRLQAGTVLAIQQYSDKIWKSGPRGGPLVRQIVEVPAT